MNGASFLKIPLLRVSQQEKLIWLLKTANSHKRKSLLLFWKCKLKRIFFYSVFYVICGVYDNLLTLLSPFVWLLKTSLWPGLLEERNVICCYARHGFTGKALALCCAQQVGIALPCCITWLQLYSRHLRLGTLYLSKSTQVCADGSELNSVNCQNESAWTSQLFWSVAIHVILLPS